MLQSNPLITGSFQSNSFKCLYYEDVHVWIITQRNFYKLTQQSTLCIFNQIIAKENNHKTETQISILWEFIFFTKDFVLKIVLTISGSTGLC